MLFNSRITNYLSKLGFMQLYLKYIIFHSLWFRWQTAVYKSNIKTVLIKRRKKKNLNSNYLYKNYINYPFAKEAYIHIL